MLPYHQHHHPYRRRTASQHRAPCRLSRESLTLYRVIPSDTCPRRRSRVWIDPWRFFDAVSQGQAAGQGHRRVRSPKGPATECDPRSHAADGERLRQALSRLANAEGFEFFRPSSQISTLSNVFFGWQMVERMMSPHPMIAGQVKPGGMPTAQAPLQAAPSNVQRDSPGKLNAMIANLKAVPPPAKPRGMGHHTQRHYPDASLFLRLTGQGGN